MPQFFRRAARMETVHDVWTHVSAHKRTYLYLNEKQKKNRLTRSKERPVFITIRLENRRRTKMFFSSSGGASPDKIKDSHLLTAEHGSALRIPVRSEPNRTTVQVGPVQTEPDCGPTGLGFTE